MDHRGNKGHFAEEMARHYLEQQGLRLVERNYRCPPGELDLVMLDGRTVVFVEVRYRRNPRFGTGAETVDKRKQAKLISAALHYLQSKRVKQPSRFDVISITPMRAEHEIQWIQNAFDAH
jgi:putative endonuclease